MGVDVVKRVLRWWDSLPLGYSELHAPLDLTRDEFRHWIRRNFADRLPTDTRARNIRVQFLTEDHCIYKRAVNHLDHRPHIDRFKCRRH